LRQRRICAGSRAVALAILVQWISQEVAEGD
jgi:hypothetical protein